jgi:hypothetical protein
MKLVPALQELRLIRDLWYSRLAGTETRCFYPVGPELFTEPTISLPSRATGDETYAVNVCGVCRRMLTLIVAGTTFSNGRKAAAGRELVVAVRVQPRLPSSKRPHHCVCEVAK